VILADDDLLHLVEQPLHRGRPILSVVLIHACLPLAGPQ
jgi:hypothetical protein